MQRLRLVSVLLCICIALSLCGCSDSATQSSAYSGIESKENAPKSEHLQMLYNYSDSLDPYKAETALNRRLSRLLFDSLVTVNNDFEAVYCIAESAELSEKSCTVKLKNILFTDSSTLTADDVIYSYNVAKNSSTVYCNRFYEVTGVTALSKDTVSFSLNRIDPYFINLLDFPIIKAGSDKNINADGVAEPTIGSGRYTVNAEKNMLIVNTLHYSYNGNLKDIELTNAPDEDSVSHYVEVGATDVYYTDVSGGNIVRMSGKKTDVNLNNLVYIGINNNYADLSGQYIRYAISSALDRTAICKQAYFNNAVSATGFYSPAFKDTKSRQTLESKPNVKITVENLKQIGYNSLDKDGFYCNSKGKHPTFNLLVNSDNQSRVSAANLIAEQLKSAGMEIRVTVRSFEEYKAALESGSFQLYLGEIQFQNNMDLSQLVLKGGTAAYGIGKATEPSGETPVKKDENSDNSETETTTENTQSLVMPYGDMLAKFYAGEGGIGIGDVAGALLTEMPQIPICYRLGLVFYDGNALNCKSACADDIYYLMQTVDN